MGYRLERPKMCPAEVYQLMMKCWQAVRLSAIGLGTSPFALVCHFSACNWLLQSISPWHRTLRADLPLGTCMELYARCRVTGMTTARQQSDNTHIHLFVLPLLPIPPSPLVAIWIHILAWTFVLPMYSTLRVCVSVCLIRMCHVI